MQKYLNKYNKLQKPYKVSIIAIGISVVLLIFIFILVLIPLLNISNDEANVVASSKDFDRISMLNNILSVLVIVSSVISLIFAVFGRRKHVKKRSKK
jgi:uncharacterized BrkB/YihY/UPF0761 family membrane protein